MIPAGYMAKRIMKKPHGLVNTPVEEIYSVSGCISSSFMDYINHWKHNGYWLFNHPDIISELARQEKVNLEGTQLFYYEIYEREFNNGKWQPFLIPIEFETAVIAPPVMHKAGYDVVTFYAGPSPEHSPLSCNTLWDTISVNRYCLLNSFELAKNALEKGLFEHSEPGPYRIYSVYTVPNWLS